MDYANGGMRKLIRGGGIALIIVGSVPEWLKGTGCKPVGVSLRWFESTPAQLYTPSQSHFYRGVCLL